MPEFVHLQCHSEFSISSGLLKLQPLLKHAKSLAMPAVAITDYANMYALVKFFTQACANKIKPIFAAELYLENAEEGAPPQRILLYCKDMSGYKNLAKIITKSYYNPRQHHLPVVSKEYIAKHKLGLIAISPTLHSDISRAILQGNLELAETLCEYWMGVFTNSFYLGLTRTKRPHEEQCCQHMLKIAKQKNCPVVALNDVNFLHEEDFVAHEARTCIAAGEELNSAQRQRTFSSQQYFKDAAQMTELFKDVPSAIANTLEISKRCNLELTLGEVYLPNYPVPKNFTTEAYLESISYSGLCKRFPNLGDNLDDLQKYEARLASELKVINKMGFAGYFLIVADFINWANTNNVPVGPGRGSGAGSLVAYALKITNINPIKYDLLFERFLNPERVSMPDFDIDFCMEGRDRVIDYVAQKYGKESVAQIITFGTMAAKAVVRDVGRVLGYPYGFVDKIAKLIPNELGMTLDKALIEEETLKQRYTDEDEVKNLIDLAKKLEGMARNVGKHAGGVVIAPKELTEYTPLYCEVGEQQGLTQLDKNDVEAIGLIKFDFLGLRTLTIIDWAVKDINQSFPELNFNIDEISLNCPQTFTLLQKKQTTAIFQLESRGMKDLIGRLIPDRFEDIVALVALFRPGPLQSGMVDDFIDRKLGRAEIQYAHPALQVILQPTYGVILYQEQVMQIAQELAGYTLGAADLLRRAMGKKKAEEMALQREIFVSGCIKNQISEQIATYIFDLMEKFAGYGFNKSHSAAYALVSYQTAWLKTHYPGQFMAAVLSSDMANTDKVVQFIEDCAGLELQIVPPDINRSVYKFSCNANTIIFGLGAIKGVGNNAIDEIIQQRQQAGPYKSLLDLCQRVCLRKVTRRVLESLIFAGAFDSLSKHRAAFMASLAPAIQAGEQLQKNKIQGQLDMFAPSDLTEEDVIGCDNLQDIASYDEQTRLKGEKDTLGLYLSGHPINQYMPTLQKIITTNIKNLHPEFKSVIVAGFIIAMRTMNTKRGDKMAFITLDDKSSRQEVAIFSDLFKQNRELIIKDNLVIIEGDLQKDNFTQGLKLKANKVFSLEQATTNYVRQLIIKVKQDIPDFAKKLQEILKQHQDANGLVPAILLEAIPSSCARFSLDSSWRVLPTSALKSALEKISSAGVEVDFVY